MLRTIIKRDGSHERFDLVKLAKWGQWAAEGIEDRVNWSAVMLRLANSKEKIMTSKDVHMRAIGLLLRKKTWSANLMAGRLLAPILYKETYGQERPPTVKEQYEHMVSLGLMETMSYTDEDFEKIEAIIDHKRDFDMVCFQLKQIYYKYALNNRVKVGTRKVKKQYETPQFVFMRMAMALAEDEPLNERMMHLENWYNEFSSGRINAPTPNYVNLGTKHNGLLSCCLYTTKDTAASLSIGAHIATEMTVQSAGIGGYIACRSEGDDVRGGAIIHQGKFPYIDLHSAGTLANTQGGRGGALSEYYIAYDPQAIELAMAQNPRTPVEKQRRKLHFAVMKNEFLVEMGLMNKDVFTWNIHTAPSLHVAFFQGDESVFRKEYERLLNDDSFEKNFVSARDLIILFREQSIEVSTNYHKNSRYANHHTPFKETIYSSNLCVEIYQPTSGYENMIDLYKEEDHGRGEVSMCGLGGVVVSRCKTRQQHYKAAWYCLRMIDKCIHRSNYRLPHVGFTAKKRLNAGVGILGLAHHLATLDLTYDSEEGLKEIHRVSEQHMYVLIEAALDQGKKYGNAPWINKTKWPDGWMPIDTYHKTVDSYADFKNECDWEDLRKRVVENGGLRFSTLCSHMPTESSSKASATTNGPYPIRDLALLKTDAKNSLDWCAPDGDILKNQYQLAWAIKPVNMFKAYGVIQKFTDGGISADIYRDRSKVIEINKTELLEEEAAFMFGGPKGQYYYNSLTPQVDESDIYGSDYVNRKDEDSDEDDIEVTDPTVSENILIDDVGGNGACGSGGCTL